MSRSPLHSKLIEVLFSIQVARTAAQHYVEGLGEKKTYLSPFFS